MRLFFVDPLSISSDTAYLSASESQHIAKVLRLKPGDIIQLFDGTGKVYEGRLITISPDKVSVELLATHASEPENIPQLILYQGLLKGKKMDFLVQKSTELGVNVFQPLMTRFCENRGNHARQHERWQRIMLEACKQSKRPYPMQVNPVFEFNQIHIPGAATKLLLWEDERQQAIQPEMIDRQNTVCLLIGPEGGFHQDEIAMARDKGFYSITLGKGTLRAETATLAAVSIVQYLKGNLG